MTPIEIFLVIIGLIIVILSFFIFEKFDERKNGLDIKDDKLYQEQIKKITEESIKSIRSKMNEVFSEMVDDSIEKTDKELSTISNEKIMSTNDFSNQILEKIDLNHKEVLFLYSMLTDKEKEIKDTLQEIDKAKNKVKKLVDSMDRIVEDTIQKAIEKTNFNITIEDEFRKKDINKSVLIRPELNKREDINFKKVDRQITFMENDKESTTNKPNRMSEKIGLSDNISNDNIQEFKVLSSQNRSKYIFTEEEKNGNNNDQILKLYEEGKSAIEIAKILGLGQGEVKFVIGLFRGVKK